jgi:hypothetical protein
VGLYGLRGRDVGSLPQSREEFDRHMMQIHGKD